MVGVPELRTDCLTGDRVVVAPGRAQRPGAWATIGGRAADTSGEDCPFCEGHEAETPPELYAIPDSGRQKDRAGWRVRVVPNKFPAFSEARPAAANGVFAAEAAAGVQDVVVHAPRHLTSIAELEAACLEDVAAAWRWRAGEGSPAGTVYLHAVINEGREAGASLAHSHSQLFSLGFLPPRLAVELERQEQAEDCIACTVISEEIGRAERVLWSAGGLVAYCPYASRFPYETVIAPIACERDAFSSPLLPHALQRAAEVLRRLRAEVGWAPVNLWVTTSPREDARTHWRLTVAPRLTRAAGLELGADLAINAVPPEQAAAALRQA